jgi:hypothetical protein
MPTDNGSTSDTQRPATTTGARLELDLDILKPLIKELVHEAVAQLKDNLQVNERPYTEAEAAEWLGVGVHVLRDERLRKRIKASRIACRRIRYLRSDLEDYLKSRRCNN